MTKASTYSIADTNAQALGHSSDGRNVNFYSAVNGNRVVVYVARYGGGWAWQGDFEYFYNEANIVTIGSGGKKNLMQTGAVRQHSRHDISVMTAKVVTGTTNSYRSTAVFAGFLTSGIVGLSPSNGSSIQTTNPDLIARVNIGLRRGQGRYKVYFQFATDDQFSQASSKSYTQPDEKYTIVDGTQDQGPDTYINIGDTLPDEITLTGPTWYYRANLIDEWGNFGPYSAVNNFFIGHAPLAITKSYNGGRTYFAEGTDFQGFNWEFTDPSPTDYQTAFQWRLCTSNGQVIYDTGKVLSVNENINYPAASGNKDTVLYWEVKVWDSEDTPGVWSDKAFFTLTDPAEVTIDSPSFGTAVTTGVPTFVFTMSTGGTRTIKEYTITVSQNGITLWNSRIGGPWPSGTQISRKFPPNILKNNQPYTVTVSIVDSVNLFATDVSSFRTEWVPPSAPDDLDVNIGLYNSEDDGYIFVTWSDDARDPDFSSWGIYRKDDLIDPNTNEVLEPGSFKLMFMEYETKANYEFRDFFAPAGYRVTYLVRQYITRDGHDMDSGDSNAISHVPTSDGYWLIEPNSDNTDADAFKLSTVTSDDFSEGREQEEMIVIGRGRRFSVGESLGMAGSLTAQIRDSPGNSARQKRMRLKQIQDTDSQLWLRNPFGDTFRVNVGNMEISRIAGVGRSEFVDVTIPYAEVGK